MPANSPKPVAQCGRPLGPRAIETRQRLMDATREMLAGRNVLDISVVDIARAVGSSPATFYHYFRDVEEVALRLAEQANEETPALLELIDGPWQGKKGLDTARAIVDGFINHWDAHHAVLQLRNLAADRGDRRFLRVRQEAVGPILDRFAERIEKAQADGKVSATMHPYVAAAALGAVLERLSAYHNELAHFGATRQDLVETCARIVLQTLTGRAPR